MALIMYLLENKNSHGFIAIIAIAPKSHQAGLSYQGCICDTKSRKHNSCKVVFSFIYMHFYMCTDALLVSKRPNLEKA